uniref:AT16039p n=1 Tax=Drosophila melanogaster TaxID=7227 RepID=F5XVH0_DROME|nr:AT16039p [Drosophila melanogaster]
MNTSTSEHNPVIMPSGHQRSENASPPSIRGIKPPYRSVRNAQDGVISTFLDKYSRPNYFAIRLVIPAELPPIDLAEILMDMLKMQILRRKNCIASSNWVRMKYICQYGSKADETFIMHDSVMRKLQQAIEELTNLLDQLKLAYEPVSYGRIAVQAQQLDKRAQIWQNLLNGRNEQLERRLARDISLPYPPAIDARMRISKSYQVINHMRTWRFG